MHFTIVEFLLILIQKHALDDEEWDKVEGICKFLGIFYNVTRLFSGWKYPTANLYFPYVFLVQLTLMKAIEDRNYVARSLATQMKPKFDKYWDEYNTILVIAVVFDPRYKAHFFEFSYKMLYREYCEQITLLHETLKQLFDLYKDRIPKYTVVCEPKHGTSLHMEGSDVMKVILVLE